MIYDIQYICSMQSIDLVDALSKLSTM
jgi:hypothetical protein